MATYRQRRDMAPKDTKMHERITALEHNHRSVITRIDSVETTVSHLSDKIDKVLEFVQEARVKQLPPFQTIIATFVATFTLISMIVGGLYWMIDTRVGYGVARSNAFVQQLSDGPNNIYVQLFELKSRISVLEKNKP